MSGRSDHDSTFRLNLPHTSTPPNETLALSRHSSHQSQHSSHHSQINSPNPQSQHQPIQTEPETEVAGMLSTLQLNTTLSAEERISAQDKLITALQKEVRKMRETLRDVSSLPWPLLETSLVSHGPDLIETKLALQNKLLALHNRFENSILDQNSVGRQARDMPHQPQLWLSGAIAETNPFFFDIRELISGACNRFRSEKHTIMWIARHFLHKPGVPGSVCASYTWWRGLLTRNATTQGLESIHASSDPPYVLKELLDWQKFLLAIQQSFL
ncbi:hypothetical protein MJO28_015621 [Puccinia striiformis f. sp. tritici]|uniref:Uncharacterized protein n=1 Tax=Puccinia striiformis f. sp. tritici TaxID=168172 RepID=A0ACC0DQD6_9BASI|nr:hypothetical protein MJO28_015621 [Puccinia striiformis f. sp. tritici]